MRYVASFLLLAMLLGRASDLPLQDGSHLAFVGHSLTLEPTGLWADYLSVEQVLMHPELNLTPLVIAHSGLSIDGEFTNSDITLQEYPKYVVPFFSASSATNFVFFMFGGAGTLANHQSNVQVLIDTYITPTPALPIIVGMTPEPDASGFSEGVDYESAEVAAANSYTPHKVVTTTWSALQPRFTNSANWDALKFDPVGDPSNVHPSKAANVAVAWTNLMMLGWDTNVSDATIDATAMSISETNHCTLRSLSGSTTSFSFIRHDTRMPWAIDEAGRHDATNIWPEMIGWQNYRLTVTNLPSGSYRVTINGVRFTVSSAALAAGWNMADLTNGPAHDIGQATLNAFRDLQDLDHVSLTTLNTTKGWSQLRGSCRVAYEDNGLRGSALVADAGVQAALASISTLQTAMHSAAQPQDFTNTVSQIITRYAPFHR